MWHAEQQQEAGGWLVVDETNTAEPDAIPQPKPQAQAEAARLNAAWRNWERAGLADDSQGWEN